MNVRLFVKVFLIANMLLGLCPVRSTCAEQNGKKSPPLKIGFIMVGSLNDLGWNYQHNQGRLYLESKLKGEVETTAVENVPENSESERIMEKMIAQGDKLIYSTSYGYFEPAIRVAARHPDVIIMQCGRPMPQPLKNVGTYFGRYYEPMYVAGLVSGRMTRKMKSATLPHMQCRPL